MLNTELRSFYGLLSKIRVNRCNLTANNIFFLRKTLGDVERTLSARGAA